MLDFSHIPVATGNAEVYTFVGSDVDNSFSWLKPRGKSMIDILIVGRGGNGGNGAVGAASTAAGGGGGGSGGQTRLTMPLSMLPDRLFLHLRGAGQNSTVRLGSVAGTVIVYASPGGNGGNASGATAGAAGTAGAIATAANMRLGWVFASALAGQAGVIGATTGAGGALTLPVTGLLVTGGTGGGGVGNAASTGSAGGAFTVAGVFPAHAGGLAAGSQTAPAGNGRHGYRPIPNLMYGYGGTGGGSTGGAATGAGLVAGHGGNGAPGCGGGGGGGGFTGSTQGLGGSGGPAFCIITCW